MKGGGGGYQGIRVSIYEGEDTYEEVWELWELRV